MVKLNQIAENLVFTEQEYIKPETFLTAKEKLEQEGYTIANAQRIAQLRMQRGGGDMVSKLWSPVPEAVIYIPYGGRFFTKQSPILTADPEQVARHYQRRKPFSIWLTDLESSGILQTALEIPFHEGTIPTNEFGKQEITKFLFGEDAEKYGEFLQENGLKEIPIKLSKPCYTEEVATRKHGVIKNKRISFVYQLEINSINNESTIYGTCNLGLSSTGLIGIKE